MENKPSLFNAAHNVSELMELIDSEEILHERLLDEFNDASVTLSEAIDRRKYVVAECDTRIETAKKMMDEIKQHIKRIEKTKDKIKETTIQTMKSNPDVPYKDSLGRKLSLTQSQGKVVLDIDSKSFTLSNCIDESDAHRPEIAPYVKTKLFFQLDLPMIGCALKSGGNFDWAHLERKTGIRGL